MRSMLSWLTKVHPRIAGAEDRYGARLFAAIMLVQISVVGVLLAVADTLWRRLVGRPIWGDGDTWVVMACLATTSLAFGVLRAGFYRPAVLLYVAATGMVGLIAPFIASPYAEVGLLSAAVIPVLLTAIAFSHRWVLAVIVVVAGVAGTQLSLASHAGRQTITGFILLVVVLMTSALILVFRRHLSALEARRLESIRQSEATYRNLFETVTDGIVIVDAAGRVLEANQAACRQLGYARDELVGLSVADFSPAAPLELAAAPGLSPGRWQAEHIRKDGTALPVELAATPIQYSGQPALLMAARDQTERRRAEEAQERSLHLLEAVVQQTPIGLAVCTAPEMAIRHVNEVALDLLGAKGLTEPLGLSMADVVRLRPWVHLEPDGTPAPIETLPLVSAVRGEVAEPREFRIRRSDGTEIWALTGASPIYDGSGTQVAAVLTVMDVTERKRGESALRQSEARLRGILDSLSAGVIATGPTGHRVVYINPAAAHLLAISLNDAIGRPRSDFVAEADGNDGRQPPGDTGLSECRLLAMDGRSVPVLRAAVRAFLGEQECLLESVIDLSSLRAAEEEKAVLEARLLHSQRMEAVGQLAGGVAHDFNNLLQAINGYTELALQHVAEGDPAHHCLRQVASAGDRAAELVSHLLAFSRQQVMKPELVDINDTVSRLLAILRRVIGEHIELQFRPGKDLGAVYADRGMLDQVLMNLCVNARDAMPDGGVLSIETRSVSADDPRVTRNSDLLPGPYTLLSVSDTGCGMDQATLARAFEPFFTTKGVGEGTGLGLSTVYGIVAQHGGLVTADSEPGVGTSFCVYLPPVDQPAEQPQEHRLGSVPHGTETVLIAEDDDAVRELSSQVLTGAGYTTLAAHNGSEALELLRSHMGGVDLLLVDAVMPQMGGRALLDEARRLVGDLPVLFASGYSPGSVHTGFALDQGLNLLQKPYRPADLLRRVREVLDGAKGA